MRVVLACGDADRAEWLAHILGTAGLSVVVLSEISASSPELRGAELIIADSEAAAMLGDAGPARRLLLSSRGSTVDMSAIEGRFLDVLALPASEEEVVARVNHVLSL